MKTTAAFAMISALSLAACGKPAAVPADSASAAATQQVPEQLPAAAPAVPAASPAATTAIPPAAAARGRAATAAPAAPPATKPTPVEASVPARSEAKPPAVTPPRAAAVANAPDDSTGKVWYEENCRKCHGVRGVPSKVMQAKFPKLAAFDAAFFAVRSNDSVVTVLSKGKGEGMRSFNEKLTQAQMVSVASYIRSFGR